MSAVETAAAGSVVWSWVLRIATVLVLIIDAVVHLNLASSYQLAAPGGIGGGTLFRIQGGAAILAAVYVLVRGTRPAFVIALLVAASALAAVLLYRYVDVPMLGPIPAMYEPVWFFQKSLSATAEALGTVIAAVALSLFPRARHRTGSHG